MVFQLFTPNNHPIVGAGPFASYAEAQSFAMREISADRTLRGITIREQSDAKRSAARRDRDVARRQARQLKHS